VYKIVFTKEAARSIQKMPRQAANLVREKIELLASDPYSDHLNVKKLQGRNGYRLRVGDWRVLYEIKNDQLFILILKVAPRGEVYR
jgi:mRNA interferase RelE/StbE